MACLGTAGVAYTIHRAPLDKPIPKLAAHLREHGRSRETYLIPPSWKWFRLETGMPIFVDFKSHPYKDIEVIEWHRRLTAAKAFYAATTPTSARQALERITEEWNITHVVTPDDWTVLTELPHYVPQAQGQGWRLYRIDASPPATLESTE